MIELDPIAPGLWTEGSSPQLIGGKLPSGEIVFPMPTGEAAKGIERYPLSRTGTLWSWTSQNFRPKPPYEGPGDGPQGYEPFLLGYVELPGEVIVESYIVDATLEKLKLGMPMVFKLTPFDEGRATFAFAPETPA